MNRIYEENLKEVFEHLKQEPELENKLWGVIERWMNASCDECRHKMHGCPPYCDYNLHRELYDLMKNKGEIKSV